MKLTSARKDYGIYGFMVVVFLAGTIAFFVRYGTSEIWYTLLMVAFLLVSLYFFTCTLRFRVMWDAVRCIYSLQKSASLSAWVFCSFEIYVSISLGFGTRSILPPLGKMRLFIAPAP